MFIDRILIDAIESSPHTTPQKKNNRVIYNYRKILSRKWKFGDDADDEESGEDEGEGGKNNNSWEIVKEGEGRLFLKKTI